MSLAEPRFDREAHLLRDALLFGVNADVAIDDEVVDENRVADFAQPWRRRFSFWPQRQICFGFVFCHSCDGSLDA